MHYRRLWPLLCSLLLCLTGMAQQKQWVFFADKGPFEMDMLAAPETCVAASILQQRLDKRIPLDKTDLPLHQPYIEQLRMAGIEVRRASRWMNAVSIEGDHSLTELQQACPAVTAARPVASFQTHAVEHLETFVAPVPTGNFDYGLATNQTEMIGVDCLHDRGFTGTDILLAVLDAGFRNMDTLSAFDSLRLTNRLVDWYDFVDGDTTLFQDSPHGMAVASSIAGQLPGQYLGTAPHISLLLARTEDVAVEVHQEEDNWLAAVEWADSLGADMIHSSLGYAEFDAGEGDYTYADLDGNTTIVARAADLAAAKGILVVVSAGNLGNTPWHYIATPCDGDSILCVGSVGGAGLRSYFSSVGPSSDGQIKPDVMALGQGTAVAALNGGVGYASGTSLAAPLVAGMAACLLQAHPQRNNMDVIEAIRMSGDRAANPDTAYGYGIPNACIADSILTAMDSTATALEPASNPEAHFSFFPNPVNDVLALEAKSGLYLDGQLELLAPDGRLLQRLSFQGQPGMRTELDLTAYAAGMYILRITAPDAAPLTYKFLRP